MIGFAIGATLLVGVAVLLLLLPFRRRPASAEYSRRQLNAAIYRDEFAELERDRAEGALTQADFEQAQAELQRRLLEDSASAEETAAITAVPPSRTVPAVLALAVPLCAVLFYLALGSPAGINPPPPEQKFTAADIERMVAGMAAKLEKEPENYKGWAMLARSYKVMGRYAEAARAYAHVGPLLDENADLLIDYADTLAAVENGFTPQVLALIGKALQLDPANAQGLWLRGTAAFEAKRFDQAIADWEALLKQLPADSEEAGAIARNIDEARGLQAKSKPAGKK